MPGRATAAASSAAAQAPPIDSLVRCFVRILPPVLICRTRERRHGVAAATGALEAELRGGSGAQGGVPVDVRRGDSGAGLADCRVPAVGYLLVAAEGPGHLPAGRCR